MRPAADTAMQVPADSGATAQAEEESTYHLSADERDHLHFLEAEISSDPSEDPDGFVEQAHDAARNLPSSLLRRLRRFARFGSCHGVLCIRGHRIGHVPPTPPDNTHYLGEKTGLAKQQAIISSILGEMIAYEAEGAGKLFQDIGPSSADG